MAKPTIYDGVSTLELEHPESGTPVRRNLWDKVSATTKNGTSFERVNFHKFIYELDYKNMTRAKYDEAYNFLITALNAGRSLYFSYTDRWTLADNVQVLVSLGDDESQGGSVVATKLVIEEVVKR